MKEGKDTREKILDVAFEEFYTNGYNGTGLNTILEKAGIQKGSLYHFFASKKELGLAVINERITNRFKSRYGNFPASAKPLESLLVFLSDPNNFDMQRGCPLGKLINELSNTDKDFEKALLEVYEGYEALIQESLESAIIKGELKPCDTKTLATFIGCVIAGTIQRAKLGNDEAIFKENVQILKNLL